MGNYINAIDVEDSVSKSLIEGFLSEVYGSDEYDRKLASVISQAEGIVDAYLGSRYVIPVTPTAFIVAISVSLAEYLLYKKGTGGKIPEKIEFDYKSIITQLTSIAGGRTSIGSATEIPSSTTLGGGFEIDSDDPEFDKDNMSTW